MKTESKDAKFLHTGRKFNYDRVKVYHQQFIDNSTSKFYSEYTKKRVCPVCSNNDFQPLFQKSGGTYVKCKSCTMILTNPVFKESALKKYYENLNTGQAEITAKESNFYREIYTLGLNIISQYVDSGKILDIGCSSGFFLDLARDRNWTTAGIELGKIEADLCKNKGHQVFIKSVEKIKFKEKFDAITLWDVFEHIVNGKRYLNLLSKILSRNGVIFMQIPNSDSLAARIMGEKCNMFDGVEHVNLYNPATINLIAKSGGFKITHLSSVISEISVINNYLDYEDPYFGSSVYKNKILGIIGEKEIHANKLGYKLQIILKKDN